MQNETVLNPFLPKEEDFKIPLDGPIKTYGVDWFHAYQDIFTKKHLKQIFANAENNGLTAIGAILDIEGVKYVRSDLFWKWVLEQTAKPAEQVQL